ncbi:MAG: endonuclease III [Candidatus Acidoferrales bacterium]
MAEGPKHPRFPVPFRFPRVRNPRKLPLKQRVKKMLERFDKAYPKAACALAHRDPLQLLVATILSAQCTDERVNRVTKPLFKKYKSAKDFAYADPRQFEQEIKSTGFFRAKTKSILGAGKALVEKHKGKVPRTMGEMLELPGVARKTANVVLGTAYGLTSGIVVDTHVTRIAQRLDLTQQKDPKKIEQDLLPIIPTDKWILISHQMIWHGRLVCQARKPRCMECPVEDLCYSRDKTI